MAVDGSENSFTAAQVAINLSKKHGAVLTVLNVMYTPAYWLTTPQSGMPPVYLTEFREQEKKEADEVVKKVLSMAEVEDLEAKGEVLSNIPSIVQAITDYAANERIDLIVVGTRGLGGFRKLLLGSISSGVASHAPCSVLVVR